VGRRVGDGGYSDLAWLLVERSCHVDSNAIAALVGLMATLLGLIIGRFWEARSESARWRRDQRIRAYQAAADSFYALRDALRDLAQTTLDDEAEKNAKFGAVTRVGVTWNSSLVAVWLFGSERAASAALKVDLQIDELAELARVSHHPFWEWHRTREPAQTAFDAFLDEVRKDLELAPFVRALRKDPAGMPHSARENASAVATLEHRGD
jgi:hypothetical protein